MWVLDASTKRIVKKQTTYVPGFFKIFDEIMVNAADNKQSDPSMTTIKVDIDRESNTISVANDGKGIPVQIHSRTQLLRARADLWPSTDRFEL